MQNGVSIITKSVLQNFGDSSKQVLLSVNLLHVFVIESLTPSHKFFIRFRRHRLFLTVTKTSEMQLNVFACIAQCAVCMRSHVIYLVTPLK